MENVSYIGTAGWSYPHWDGVVYPQNKGPAFHPLELIAKYANVVEINSSFYQALRPELTRLWMKKVEHNPNFQFTAKLNQNFTHKRLLIDSEIAAFKEGLRPLQKAKRLGALLMQFPWSYRFNEENKDFFIRLRRAFHDFPLVAEMRHDSWMSEEALGTFLDYKVGFCNVDQPQHTRAMPPTALLTTGIGYVRLHGRNPINALGSFEAGAPRAKQHDYLYNEAELAEWSKRIEHISRFADKTFVIFNNDAAGKSFVNALQLEKMMGLLQNPAPITLRRKFPVQLEHFGRHNNAEQQVLFPAA
jgi:uncharacterized protein YecE (DUF72 family)